MPVSGTAVVPQYSANGCSRVTRRECWETSGEITMKVPADMFYLVPFFLQLFEVGGLEQCGATSIVHFDKVCPTTRTPAFCAVTHADVTQRNNEDLQDCSLECANSDLCVAFNHNEPQLVCELFHAPFSSLSLTPGCTHYEVVSLRSMHGCSRKLK